MPQPMLYLFAIRRQNATAAAVVLLLSACLLDVVSAFHFASTVSPVPLARPFHVTRHPLRTQQSTGLKGRTQVPVRKTLGLRAGPNPDELGVGRRAAIAAILSPVLAVLITYIAVPLLLNPAIREQSWYKERFSTAMARMDDYESNIAGMKENLFAVISNGDNVVEIGAGLGPNLKYFKSNITYTAVEPNPYFHTALDAKLKGKFAQDSTIVNDIRLVPTASAEVVVSTLVLCSVKSQADMLEEILRVLKPGGKLLFLEHVIEPSQGYPSPYNIKNFDWDKAYYRWTQQFVSPLQQALADGCHSDRDTVKAISQKFSEVFVKRFRIPELWGSSAWWDYYPIGPQVAGIAIKRPLSYAGELAEIQFKFCAADMQVIQSMPADAEGSEKQAAWARDMQKELAKPTRKIKCRSD